MVTVVITINPGQLLAQARDSNRLSDVNTIDTAINLSRVDSIALGSSTITYISIPDMTATSTAGDQCQGLNLPPLPSPYTYHCSASSTYRKVDGTGWIPINFTQMSSGAPFSQIPIDPVNQTSSNLFYTYTTDGSTYEVTGILESQKYKTQFEVNPQNPLFPGVVEKGNNLALSELYNSNGLVGYWPLNEGSGTIAIDQSGNNNNGTWSGTPSSPNSTYYGAGKIGNYAGWFDGSTDYISISTSTILNNTFNNTNSFTLTEWVNYSGSNGYYSSFSKGTSNPGPGFTLHGTSGRIEGGDGTNNLNAYMFGPSLVGQGWQFIAITYNGINFSGYLNGISRSNYSWSYGIGNTTSFNVVIGRFWGGFYYGLIDEARVYNRALSPAEIQAIYNAQK
jgi:hypothetical protein